MGTEMLKVEALAWCDVLRQQLRDNVEDAESGMNVSHMMGSLFGDPSGCDSRSMLADRKEWAHTLAILHELEEGLGSLDDEWWNGPKMKKPKEKDFEGLFRTRNDVQRQLQEAMKQWEQEQRNEHWSRRKEAEAQRENPDRKFRIRAVRGGE